MVDGCVKRYGRLDILFCNAGINLPKLLVDSTDEEIDGLLAVNLKGPLYAARHAIPIMLRQPEGGVLLFTASKTGLVAQTDSPVYCASKGAVVLLAKALALDYATRGVSVPASPSGGPASRAWPRSTRSLRSSRGSLWRRSRRAWHASGGASRATRSSVGWDLRKEWSTSRPPRS